MTARQATWLAGGLLLGLGLAGIGIFIGAYIVPHLWRASPQPS